MQRRKQTSVLGPYRHRNRWQIIAIEPDGSRLSFTFDSQAEALREKETLTQDIASRDKTIGALVPDFEGYLRQKGDQPQSVRVIMISLSYLTRSLYAVKPAQITTKHAKELYTGLIGVLAVDTHRQALSRARAFWRFLIETKHATVNPWSEVKPMGKRNKQKKQLTIDQSRVLSAFCVSRAKKGKQAPMAILLCLLLGLRAVEVRKLEAQHVDDNGKLLRVVHTKNDTAKRLLVLPEFTRELLLPFLRNLKPDDKIFNHGANWLNQALQMMCKKLDLPIVSGHSLRGAHATFATLAGATSKLVAAQLGHTGDQTSKDHYIKAEALEVQAIQKATEALFANLSPEVISYGKGAPEKPLLN